MTNGIWDKILLYYSIFIMLYYIIYLLYIYIYIYIYILYYIILYVLYMLYICKGVSDDHDFKGNCGYRG